jgi:hypothetical protein
MITASLASTPVDHKNSIRPVPIPTRIKAGRDASARGGNNLLDTGTVSAIKAKVSTLCFAYRVIFDHYRFTSSQATGKSDAWSSANCGLRRVSPIAPTSAASLATRRPCGRTENVNPQPKLVPVHWPRRNERLGRPRHLRVNILPKDARNKIKYPRVKSRKLDLTIHAHSGFAKPL